MVVPALFGAVTLGPLIGGARRRARRVALVFGAEVAVAVAALILATQVLAKRDPQGSDQPVDWFALVASAAGSLLIYAGIGGLAGNDLRDPFASVPFGAGILIYVALHRRRGAQEASARAGARARHLARTRRHDRDRRRAAPRSARSRSASRSRCCASTSSPRAATGFAFWPEFLTAVASGYVFGRAVTTKWVVLTGAARLACIALAAALRAPSRRSTPQRSAGCV